MCSNLPPLDQDWAFKLRDRYAKAKDADDLRAALKRDLNSIFLYGIDYRQHALLKAQADAHATAHNESMLEAVMAVRGLSMRERHAAYDELWPAPMQDHAEAHDAVFNELLPLAHHLEEYTWTLPRPSFFGSSRYGSTGQGHEHDIYNPHYTWKLDL